MTFEERRNVWNILMDNLPKVILDRLAIVLTSITEENQNKLLSALKRFCIHDLDSFTYVMGTGETETSTSPIFEALDLLDGWILTLYIQSKSDRIIWTIKSIVGEEVNDD